MWELALMKPYLLSLGAGLLVGIVYSLLNVRSPAPPVIALVGLLGILAGEQIVPLAKRLLSDQPVTTGWLKRECAPHVLGPLPVGESKEKEQA
jgi:XapX domain-containing protein